MVSLIGAGEGRKVTSDLGKAGTRWKINDGSQSPLTVMECTLRLLFKNLTIVFQCLDLRLVSVFKSSNFCLMRSPHPTELSLKS